MSIRYRDLRTLAGGKTAAAKEMQSPRSSGFKRAVIRDYAHSFRIRVLVETGTFTGETVLRLASEFDTIYTIELDKLRTCGQNNAPCPLQTRRRSAWREWRPSCPPFCRL